MTATHYQAKQAIASLEYVLMSVKTVINGIEAGSIPLKANLPPKQAQDSDHSIQSIENQLITAVTTLSTIAETNPHYTHCLATQIEKTGKAIGKLTLDDLITLHTDCTKSFNLSPNDPPTPDSGSHPPISLNEVEK